MGQCVWDRPVTAVGAVPLNPGAAAVGVSSPVTCLVCVEVTIGRDWGALGMWISEAAALHPPPSGGLRKPRGGSVLLEYRSAPRSEAVSGNRGTEVRSGDVRTAVTGTPGSLGALPRSAEQGSDRAARHCAVPPMSRQESLRLCLSSGLLR